MARANGILLLQLPGHTTHRLQPLDVRFFGPLQTYYDQALDQWMTCHASQCVTQFDIAPLITIAYYKAASMNNAINAFKNNGCWPINRFVFNDADFNDAASEYLKQEQLYRRLPTQSIRQF